MSKDKISELTEITTGPANMYVPIVDETRSLEDRTVRINLSNLENLITTIEAGGTLPVSSCPFRLASVDSTFCRGAESRGSHNRQVFYRPKILGADMQTLALSFHAYYHVANTGDTNLTSDLTVEEVFIESPGGAVVQVTFEGNNTKLLTNGDAAIESDELTPSDFGLSAFNRGDKFAVKGIISTTSGGNIPFSNADTRIYDPDAQAAWYSSGSTTPSAGTTSGPYTVASGSAFDIRIQGYDPLLIGRLVDDSQPTVLALGDSMTQGVGASISDPLVQANYGVGYPAAASYGTDGSAPFPIFNYGISGTTAAVFNSTAQKWKQYVGYARIVSTHLGTNDIGTFGTGNLTTLQNNLTDIWADAKANGAQKLLALQLHPRSSSTDSWATIANQTVNTGWDYTEKAEQQETWLATKLADNTLDALVYFPDVFTDAANGRKWEVNGSAFYLTNDGTHGTQQCYVFTGAAYRTSVLAL